MFERVELVEYTRREELFNTVTHAAGVLFALVLGAVLLADTIGTGAWNRVVSAAVYALSLAVMYGASALYHGLPRGRLKKAAG
jgi:hemolysin III